VETENLGFSKNLLEFYGDAGLMITYNFRLGFFITSYLTSFSYESSSQLG